jgi:two-component system OmpR family sensor kinase
LSEPPVPVCRVVLDAGSALAELVHPDDRAAAYALVNGPPSAEPVELRLRAAGGDWRVLAVSRAGDVTGAAAVRAGHAALSALKSELFAVVSHELGTPLTSIASMAELLKGDGLSDRDTGAAMAAVVRNTERMLSFVEDLNALANLESGGWRGPGSAVDAADLVRDAARFVDALSPHLTVAVSVAAGPPVEGDPKLLAQLMHAVIGAAAAMATTGTVTVSGSAGEDGWTIEAGADATGLGTGERLLAAALPEPDTSPYRRSVGLSVLLARAIATSHGGTLTMAQEPGGRASITVHLPVP